VENLKRAASLGNFSKVKGYRIQKKHDKDIMIKAALCIQCAFRKMKARKSVKALRLKKSQEKAELRLKKDKSLAENSIRQGRGSELNKLGTMMSLRPKTQANLKLVSLGSCTSIKEEALRYGGKPRIDMETQEREGRKSVVPIYRVVKPAQNEDLGKMLKNKQLIEHAQSNSMKRIKSLGFHYSKEDVNTLDKRGCSPLHYAAKNGNLEMVKWLLERGADPNLVGSHGNTPVHMAVLSQNPYV
jgi:ankyrin repeat protein